MKKFTCEIHIERPRELVVEVFSNEEHFPNFQEGFQKIERLEGAPGEQGSTAMVYYQMRGSDVVLKETILQNNLPFNFAASYHHKHMDNHMVSRFDELGDGTTLYTAEVEYTAIRGFMPTLISWIYPGFFKKQVEKWMQDFKAYLEGM